MNRRFLRVFARDIMPMLVGVFVGIGVFYLTMPSGTVTGAIWLAWGVSLVFIAIGIACVAIGRTRDKL